ncbi:hypothetical protein [Elioraea sp.]|jgi:hypothetical protein|uniref:hypothetical protein n=1 Tax=Elioraea sp. TaxID=2185103 RepID=UPI003F70DC94
MTFCIGLVDLRVPSPHSKQGRFDAVAAWRAQRRRVWLTRCRITLTTDEGEDQPGIVARLQSVLATHRRGAETAELDIVCHGMAFGYSGPHVPGPVSDAYGISGLGYALQLGTGLGSPTLHHWAPVQNVFRRVRLYACGERSPTLDRAYLNNVAREQFCRRLAELLNAEVVSSAATCVYSVRPDPTPDPSIAVDGWDGSAPVMVFQPSGGRRTLPRGDRLGR